MFDIKWIRENPAAFDAGRAKMGLAPLAEEIIELDARHRAAQTELQALQSRRNEASKAIGVAMREGRSDEAEALKAEVADLKTRLPEEEAQARELAARLDAFLTGEPNLPDAETPEGEDEDANVELRRWGEPPAFDFNILDHAELGEAMGLMDFETAAQMSGSRFVILKGALARLERALAQFMLDTHTAEFGYTEVSPPLLVRDDALFGTGQLPKFADDQFRTTDDRWLIPTAEVSLTNLAAGKILDAAELPLRVTAYTACFRSEAGAAGKDTRGMLRQHQFYKVELVSIAHPEQSEEEHQRMTRCAETVLERLELPYRTVVLCTGDLGFSAHRTYDVEVWLPGQGRYREISSCSNTGDFQARRMNARFRAAEEKGTRFVHTLNGSGVAIGRALIAVLENHQRADGSVHIPPALRPYMAGVETIGPEG